MDTSGPSIEILSLATVVHDSVITGFDTDDSMESCSRNLSFSAINCSWFNFNNSISSFKCRF